MKGRQERERTARESKRQIIGPAEKGLEHGSNGSAQRSAVRNPVMQGN